MKIYVKKHSLNSIYEVVAETIQETPKGMVTIVGTKASKHLVTDKEYEVESAIAADLIRKGHATLKK